MVESHAKNAEPPSLRWEEREAKRIAARRDVLEWPQDAPHWGLALSGGGIRSATFALGVLQGLVRVAPPSDGADPVENDGALEPYRSLLARFDYLSTVSGGGYIGSFFTSLFIPGRIQGAHSREAPAGTSYLSQTFLRLKARLFADARGVPREVSPVSPQEAAREAYSVFTYEPPGRLQDYAGEAQTRDDAPGAKAMAWLRENGRYLTPTGAGDWIYAAAGAIRNWFAVHYVIGQILFTVFALIALARTTLSAAFVSYHDYELILLQRALGWREDSTEPVWWSVLWWVPVAVFFLWPLSAGVAYWLSYPNPRQTPDDPPHALNSASISAILVAAVVIVSGTWLMVNEDESDWITLFATLVILAIPVVIAFLMHAIAAWRSETVAEERVWLTRFTGDGAALAVALAMLAAVDTAAQTLYLHLPDWSLVQPAGLLAFLVWVVRKLALLGGSKDQPLESFAKIPVTAITAVAGVVVAVLVLVIWDLIVQWAVSGHTQPEYLFKLDVDREAWVAFGLACLALLLIATTARFPGFINLSTLQFVYGERLTRAYLGASNGLRFSRDVPKETRALWRSVAEPVKGDSISYKTYYAEDVLAPVHIINVTVNQTTDTAEQLVQRDRKGLPLALTPHGFLIDGTHYSLQETNDKSEVGVPLTIGQWVSTSGAAFSTGLGKQTSLGMSLLMGFANVRLGRWWPSGAAHAPEGRWPFFARRFPTQTHLFYELTARFYGLRREWQYLSDGGHFENTAVYELLRPERRIKLIVVCDDGCDPEYRFEDLGNLIRMARIDHAREVELDREIAEAATGGDLAEVFGTPEQLKERNATTNKCALLCWVYPRAAANSGARTPLAATIVLKPRLVRDAPVDLHEYAAMHERFPQESTVDQFFDEAQWESYRKLGLVVANKVFSVNGKPRDSLWEYISRKFGGSKQRGAGPQTLGDS